MDLISTAQACEILECSTMVFFRRIDQGVLKPYRKDGSEWVPGKRLYFERADILALKLVPPAVDGKEWLSVEAAAELLGIDRLSVYRLGRQGKLLSRPILGATVNGRRRYEFERGSVEEYRARVHNQPEEPSEWMPIAEAMKVLKMTRHGIKRRMKLGLLEFTHYGPPEKEALYLRRKQVEEQAVTPPAMARRTGLVEIPADELTLAWFAGFFDGEGCIHIYARQRPEYTGWVLQLSLPNSGTEALDFIAAEIGGHTYNRPRQQAHYRDQKVWQATGDEALAVLKLIRPYLRVKHRQADLAIEYQERVRSKTHGRWSKLTEEERMWRRAQQEKISRLNRPNVPRD